MPAAILQPNLGGKAGLTARPIRAAFPEPNAGVNVGPIARANRAVVSEPILGPIRAASSGHYRRSRAEYRESRTLALSRPARLQSSRCGCGPDDCDSNSALRPRFSPWAHCSNEGLSCPEFPHSGSRGRRSSAIVEAAGPEALAVPFPCGVPQPRFGLHSERRCTLRSAWGRQW